MIRNRNRAEIGVLLILAPALFLAGTINIESIPPLWWDEGWTLTVARTWVEQGHYGLLLNGQLAPAGLQAAFPVTAMVALNFRLFGVGVWQGRLVSVIFMIGAMGMLYYLARRLYNRRIAIGTLAVLLLMTMHPDTHPLLVGRQVLAEPEMMFYLLAGYACFLRALRTPLRFMPLAVILWGIALMTKAQPLPFWALSLIVPLLITLFKRRWQMANLFSIALVGSFTASRLLLKLQEFLLWGHTMAPTPIHGLYEVMAFVPVAAHRLLALKTILEFALPTFLGFCYAIWRFIDGRNRVDSDMEIVRFALLVLAGSWFGWYLTLANATVPRYLFLPIFVGSMFAAAMLWELTNRYDLAGTITLGGCALRQQDFNRQSIGSLLAIVLIAMSIPFTLLMLGLSFTENADHSAMQVAHFLNTQTASRALIETYDSEMFFLLNRRYHYPPAQIHVDLIRRAPRQDVPIDYDPLAADPDFLVVGLYSRGWHLYDPVLETGAFHLLHVYGRYQVYERVR